MFSFHRLILHQNQCLHDRWRIQLCTERCVFLDFFLTDDQICWTIRWNVFSVVFLMHLAFFKCDWWISNQFCCIWNNVFFSRCMKSSFDFGRNCFFFSIVWLIWIIWWSVRITLLWSWSRSFFVLIAITSIDVINDFWLIIFDLMWMWFAEDDDEWLQIIDQIDQIIERLEACILTCRDFLTCCNQFVVYESVRLKFLF